MTSSHTLRSWLPAYLVLAVIWGNSFLFMMVGLTSLTPAGVVTTRLALGMVTMLVISAITRSPLPARRYWKPLIIAAFPEERPTRQRVIGLGIGFLGVLVVVGVWQGLGSSTLLGIGACVLAVIGYGISYPYVRRHLATGRPDALPPLTLATGLMIMGWLQTLPFVAVTGYSHDPITPQVIGVMLALGVLGSGVAYVLNFRVINNSDATTASTVTFVITIVAVISGAVFLGEDITWNQPTGALLVIAGASVAQGLLRLPRFAGR